MMDVRQKKESTIFKSVINRELLEGTLYFGLKRAIPLFLFGYNNVTHEFWYAYSVV